MTHGVNVRSPFPWDLPWWQPDHAIFFGVLYLVLFFICLGLAVVTYRTICDSKKGVSEHNPH